jgi:hypothetical protein
VGDALGLTGARLVLSLDEQWEAVGTQNTFSQFIILSHYIYRARRRDDLGGLQRGEELLRRTLPSALASIQLTTGDEALFWMWWCVDRDGSLEDTLLFPLVQVGCTSS